MTTEKRGRRSNLTAETAKTIQTMLDNGLSQAEIAVALGRDKSTVSRWISAIRNGEVPVTSAHQQLIRDITPTPEELEDFRSYVEAHYDENSPSGWDNW